ncbi:MAG: TrkA family potassium uptake protein [Planctomycetia bacterium]|nr:TrkA family potassium uptake protein [Planctomycetia bacterium]
MPARKFIVLGLGSFGAALARRLTKNGCQVMGVDGIRERVDEIKDELYEAVIADVSDRSSLEELGLPDADAVFISLGEDITPSLLAALHAKELGAKRIIVKGVTKEHGKLLEHLGVERIVFPELEIANELGDRMAWPNVLDFLPIDPDYSIIELAVPPSCVGMTLQEADLRRRFGVWIMAIKDALSGQLSVLPAAEHRLNDDQLLLALGKQDQLERLRLMK